MDYGLFDDVRDRSVITNAEREAFFQLLAAAGKAGADQLQAKQRSTTDDFVALMERPERHRGELFSFRGVARLAKSRFKSPIPTRSSVLGSIITTR